MRSLSLRLLLVVAGALACGCSYSLHEYQAAGYAPATISSGAPTVRTAQPTRAAPLAAERIHAHAEQSVVLGITDNTDYVDEAFASLVSQCPGDVIGLNTRYSTKLGFLSYRNTIDIQALCLR
jgi:hypothetical protein